MKCRIVILPVVLIASLMTIASGQQIIVTGRVIDQEGMPISDVAVYFKDHPVSTIAYTEESGRFSLQAFETGLQAIMFERIGCISIAKTVNISPGSNDIGSITIIYGDADVNGSVDLVDLSIYEDEYLDTVDNTDRFRDYNNDRIIDSLCINLTSHGIETRGLPTNEWLLSKPDFVTLIPALSDPEFATNQHYLVTKLKNGRLLGIWTSGYEESAYNQSMLCHWSDDDGRTWSKHVIIDGPQNDNRIASWGFPIYVPERDRFYVFYNKDFGSHVYQQGELYMKYSSDGGESWSESYSYKYEPGEFTPKDTTVPPFWWAYQAPIKVGKSYLQGFTEILSRPHDIYYSTEIRFLRFNNITTIDDPNELSISTFPEKGAPGLRGYYYRKDTSLTSTLQEPSLVQLSNGFLLCMMRSGGGMPFFSVSKDSGKKWMEPWGLKYGDGLPFVEQPLASCPIYKIGDSNYVMIFHNNKGTANGGLNSGDGHRNRTPAFLLFGKEDLSKKQPITFGAPVRFLENYVRSYGPQKRTEIATYPSMTEYQGGYVLWYPDRKHFLLGKKIPKPSY